MSHAPDVSVDLAEEIIAAAEKAGAGLGDLGETVRKIEDEETRKTLLRANANLMIKVYDDIMRPLIRLYPQLDPDHEVMETSRKPDSAA